MVVFYSGADNQYSVGRAEPWKALGPAANVMMTYFEIFRSGREAAARLSGISEEGGWPMILFYFGSATPGSSGAPVRTGITSGGRCRRC